MARTDCETIRAELPAHRAGEGTPLARQRVAAHLQHCTACRSELWLLGALQDEAKRGPEPLADDHKHAVLARIHDVIDAEPRRPSPHSPRAWRWTLVPAFGLAAAAALLMLWPRELAPPSVAQGWLPTALGLEAYAPELTDLQFDPTPTAPTLRLTSAAVLARFTRPDDVGPLEVVTPHAVIHVRGTVFFVDVQGEVTTVGVAHGRVEVETLAGDHWFVAGGEEVIATAEVVAPVVPASPRFAQLEALFPSPAAQPAPVAVVPASPVRRRRPDLPTSPPADPQAIARIVARELPSARQCYERELKRFPDAAGTLEVELTYGPDGSVVEAQVLRDELHLMDMNDCILQRLSRLRFPASDAGNVTVSVPLAFTRALPARAK